jgi:hypothetical protein
MVLPLRPPFSHMTKTVVLISSLSALVPKLKQEHVQIIIDRLSQSTDASNQNAELRDISSTGTLSLEGEIVDE